MMQIRYRGNVAHHLLCMAVSWQSVRLNAGKCICSRKLPGMENNIRLAMKGSGKCAQYQNQER